jgi:PHD/YefM family antitoxin component YafN of YafNO toxin-antitoxin module
MIDVEDIHSLSDFQRNTKRYVRKLKTSGKPAILTVNGGAELVVQSAEAYQKLLEDQELLDGLRRISRSLEQARRGEGRPARAFIEELAKKHNISLRP